MLSNYLKIACKVFLRRKFFTFISLFAVSTTLVMLMVGAAIFDHVFGPSYPETRADRTLMASMIKASHSDNNHNNMGPTSYGFLDRYVRDLPHAEKVAISTHALLTLIQPVISFHEGAQVTSYLKRTDSVFWEIIEADFLEGQPFSADDVERGQPVAVINEATRRGFFGQASALGQSIEVSGQRFRIVGVVANVPAFRLASFADIWVPVTTIPDPKALSFTSITGGYEALILAKTAADIPRIKEEFQYSLSQVEFPDPERFNTLTGGAETLFEGLSRFLMSDQMAESRPDRLLAVILVLVVLFMILPAISLININVSRIMERASEIGVRKSFGAASTTLTGQFVVENVLLTLVGGLIGFGLTECVLYMLSSSYLIPYAEFHVNYRVFAYGLLMSMFFGVFAGVYPAWKMSRLHPVEALRRKVR